MKDTAYPRHEEHLAFQQVLRRLAQVLVRFRGVETRLACYLFEPVDPERKKWEISWWQAPNFHPRYFVLHMDAEEAVFLERLMEAEEVSWAHVERLPFLQNLTLRIPGMKSIWPSSKSCGAWRATSTTGRPRPFRPW